MDPCKNGFLKKKKMAEYTMSAEKLLAERSSFPQKDDLFRQILGNVLSRELVFVAFEIIVMFIVFSLLLVMIVIIR